MNENMKKQTIEKIEKKHCTGCGLCAARCPVGCILMKEDAEGFRFPQVDHLKCIVCGLCLRLCPATDASAKLYHKTERRYGCGIIKNKEMLLKSSSGGIFGALAKHIIDLGGYICGCVYSDELEAIHILDNKKTEIEKMHGSKYVQSRVEQCFPAIEEHLDANDIVMFSGTACQIAALRLYLKRDYDNLYCVEILCHGVPSPGLFKQYKLYLEKKLKGKITDIRFRDKTKNGWRCEHSMCVLYKKSEKTYEYRPVMPAYFSSFFYGLSLRESCYECKYATIERVSDLTIGDFWGAWKKYGKYFHDGISVIGINNKKGQELVDFIDGDFDFYEILSESEAISSNANFYHPGKRPIERSDFYADVLKHGYRGLWKRVYFSKSCRRNTLVSLYGAFIPAKIRFFIRRKLKKS